MDSGHFTPEHPDDNTMLIPLDPEFPALPPDLATATMYDMAHMIAVIGQQHQMHLDNQHIISSALEGLTLQIRQISDTFMTRTSTSSAVPTTNSLAVDMPRSVTHFCEPRVFDRKATDVEPFINEIEATIKLSCASLLTDHDKVLFLQSYLTSGSAKSWYTVLRNCSDGLLNNFEAVIQDFQAHFGDPDLASTTLRKIEALHQMGSCASYASKFQELLIYVDFLESTKIHKFYEGLKDDVKDIIVTVPNITRPKHHSSQTSG